MNRTWVALSVIILFVFPVDAAPEILLQKVDGTIVTNGNVPIDFGSGLTGTSATITLTIENVGDADLILTGSNIYTGDDSQFSKVFDDGATIAPAETIPVTLTFSPSSDGLKTSTFAIYSNDPVNPTWGNLLRGTGLGPNEVIQQAYLKASNADAGDEFGSSVAIDGDTAVIGAWYESSSVNVINGPQSDNASWYAGAAYVFVRDGDTWSQQAYLKASNAGESDGFGVSVAISGDTIIVGSTGEDSSSAGIGGDQGDNSMMNSGAAYVFVRSGSAWTQQAYLKASNPGADDRFGASVAIEGDTVVIGSTREDSSASLVNGNQGNNSATDAGAAYVFTRHAVPGVGVGWTQQAYLKASNTNGGDFFGYPVAISNDTIVVGAANEDGSSTGVNGANNNNALNAGSAYVFQRSGTTWIQQAYLKASNAGSQDYFGSSLDIDGDTIVVGAWGEGSNATGINDDESDYLVDHDEDGEVGDYDAGAAYVFSREAGVWTQQAYLKASNTDGDDYFGTAVSISGNTVLVGASGEDSQATGVDGDQTDNSLGGTGAAYVFVREGAIWSQQSYLKASDVSSAGVVGDFFGSQVALDRDTALVGANWEDGAAVGVNGNDADNSAHSAGAAYIFTGLGPEIPEFRFENLSGSELSNHTGLSLGDAVSGQTETSTFTIRNEGTGPLLISSAEISGGTNPGDFSVNGPSWTTIAGGTASTIEISFSPTALGPRSAELTITSNDADESPFVITLSGVGTLAPAEIVVEQPVGFNLIDGSASVGFGTVLNNASSIRTFTVRNIGGASLNLGAITIDGVHSGDFVAGLPETNNLAGGASTTFSVSFSPTAAGARSANLHFANSDSNESPFDIALGGIGEIAIPEIVVEQPVGNELTDGSASLDLGTTPFGTPSSVMLVIRSTGTGTLNLGAITIDGADAGDFTAGTPGSTSIAPGENTTLEIIFDPSAPGAKSATLHIASNDTNENPFDIALAGNALALVPEIVIEDPPGREWQDGDGPLDFGGGLAGSTGTRTLTIYNTGIVDLVLGTPGIDGSNAGEFSVGNPVSSTVAPGGFTTIGVTFTPASTGEKSAVLHLPSNDTDEAVFDLLLSGRGVDAGTIAEQAYLKASVPGASDQFGFAVALDGDTLVVGAPFEDSMSSGIDGNASDDSLPGSGAAYVFVRSGPTWIQQAYLKASHPDEQDKFGSAVAVSGDTIVIGSPFEAGGSSDPADNSLRAAGAAYVFTRTGSVWAQSAYLKASNAGSLDQFGSSVAVDGDTVAVGSPGEDSNATGVNGNQNSESSLASGAVYVFTNDGEGWSQEAYLKASNTGTSDGFGRSLGLDSDSLIVGAPFEKSSATGVDGDQASNAASNAGAAYIFVRDLGSWTQEAYLKASNTEADDRFGSCVAIDGDVVAVGAPREDGSASGINGDGALNNASFSGAAYAFERSGLTWMQTAYLKPAVTAANDGFGSSVAVSENRVVVGSRGESSNARGIDGPDNNSLGWFSGAAYVFVNAGGAWAQEAFLKASNADNNDYLGGTNSIGSQGVAIDGGTVIATATGEGGGVGGVNGSPGDNSASSAGAAYAWIGFDSGTAKLALDDEQGFSLPNGSGTLDYGPILPGVRGRISLTIRNQGSTELQLGAVSISGVDGGEFFAGTPSTSVLSTGQTATLDVVFNPSSSGAKSALLSIASNDPTADPYTIVLSGRALAPGEIAQQAYLKAFNNDNGDNFGAAVDIDGDTLVVSATEEDSPLGDPYAEVAFGSGAAYVFRRSGSVWTFEAYLKASNPDSQDFFGESVAVSGDTIVIGARGEDSNSTAINGDETNNDASHAGAAYVFVRNGSSWNQQAYLKASDAMAGDHFGKSVAIDGDTIVVGAMWRQGETGAAYVFERFGNTWREDEIITASNAQSGDQFGRRVSISGDWIAVGAESERSAATGIGGDQTDNSLSNAGAVYVFERGGAGWHQQAYLKASNSGADDYFGCDVAIDGETIVVGAWGEDSSASVIDGDEEDNSSNASGAAYVFVRNGAIWSQQAYLKAPNSDANDLFGYVVDVSGGVVVIGSNREDSSATGVNGNMFNNAAVESGATYVFTRSDLIWSHHAYLKTSNSEAGDAYPLDEWGFVAIDAGTVVTGVYGEDSNATMVNGDQSNNQSRESGAVFVWQLNFDSNGNGFSDGWERSNDMIGDDPMALAKADRDGDGVSDLLEIFQGTSLHDSGSSFGLQTPGGSSAGGGTPDGNGKLTVRYRRSRFNTGLTGELRWSTGLAEWLGSGDSVDDTTVTITETVVETHEDYEVVEATTTTTGAAGKSLFLLLQVNPNQ